MLDERRKRLAGDSSLGGPNRVRTTSGKVDLQLETLFTLASILSRPVLQVLGGASVIFGFPPCNHRQPCGRLHRRSGGSISTAPGGVARKMRAGNVNAYAAYVLVATLAVLVVGTTEFCAC